MLDLVIRGALLVDGSGRPGFRGDLGVSGERIEFLDRAPAPPGRTEFDATGLVVAPGFIDVHAHSDLTLLANPLAHSKVMQGVTTEVLGNCGFGVAPLTGTQESIREVGAYAQPDAAQWLWHQMAEYLRRLEEAKPSLNVAVLAGHIPIRAAVLGFSDRHPNPEQLAQMAALLEEALEQGCFGLSFGLIYPPSCYAPAWELAALAERAAAAGGLCAVHMRDESEALVSAVEEIIGVARDSGAFFEISHLKAAGRKNWGRTAEAIPRIEKAVASGVRLGFDAYPYAAGCTTLSVTVPARFHVGGIQALSDLLRTAEGRAEVGRGVLEERGRSTGEDPLESLGKILVVGVESERNRECQGLTLAEIAQRRGCDSLQVMLDLLLEENGQVTVIHFSMDEEEVRRVLCHPLCVVGSDSLAVAPFGPTGEKMPHPRFYGTFPKVLREFVRERGLLSLEEAVAKMTGRPAARLGIERRGLLARGNFADAVAFDPQRIADLATYRDPARYSEGIRLVLVNGKPVVRDGQHTQARPGWLLRRQAQ